MIELCIEDFLNFPFWFSFDDVGRRRFEVGILGIFSIREKFRYVEDGMC